MNKLFLIAFSAIFLLTACGGTSTFENGEKSNDENNKRPIVKDVLINGKSANYLVGDTLLTNYSYSDEDGDKEGKTTFRWFREGVEISGLNTSSYTLEKGDTHKKIQVEITPYAITGKLKGDPVLADISINQVIEYQDMRDAFDEHVAYFETRIRQSLQKDSDGYSDTYVLYDMQTYLQNAAIYADEKGDKEILERLLELVVIPFDPQYLTNGKWLNNSNNLVGKEVILPLSQYFSLLTRVLSASERHGIDVDFSDTNIEIVNAHINDWLSKEPWRGRVADTHLYFVQSTIQFYDFLIKKGKATNDFVAWKQYVQDYLTLNIAPKWEVETCSYNEKSHDCWLLDRTGFANHPSYAYAGYGKEFTKTNSDTDPYAMFDANGDVKQPKKPLSKVAMDISHGRRLNWFFESIKRFGQPFDVSINQEALEGWANNLALRVSQGTLEEPYFTIFSDGVDGWYRAGYIGRKGFGYAPGDMDIHFVGSSYGFFGVYNQKVYDWMEAWVEVNGVAGYSGAYKLNYLTSILIDITQDIKK